MGYSLCKMPSLGQKLKFQKRREKRLENHIRFVLCNKRLYKTPNIRKMTSFQKTPKLVTMHRLQPLQNAQFGSKLKTIKNVYETSLEARYSCSVQKTASKKHLLFKKLQVFENRQNWSQCIGYSLCKMVSLGQNLKFQKRREKRLENHIRFILCKKRLQKTPNIRKMTCFRK